MTDARLPRLLIPDTTPLSLLAMLGRQALDWLFVPGAEVWVTDMVRHEVLRDPDPGGDARREHRRVLREWFADNVGRVHVEVTPEGQDYEREMRNWVRAGEVPADKPSWRDRGELSIRQALAAAASLIAGGEAVVLLVDHRAARALLVQAARDEGLDADSMATESFPFALSNIQLNREGSKMLWFLPYERPCSRREAAARKGESATDGYAPCQTFAASIPQ